MDNEQLKYDIGKMMDQRFEAFGAAMDQRFQAFEVAMDGRFEVFKQDLSAVITGNCAELHTQIQEVETRANARFDTLEASVKKIGDAQIGYLRGSVSFMEWAQRTDENMRGMLNRIDAIEKRLSNPPTAA
jgi:hypothetical protein